MKQLIMTVSTASACLNLWPFTHRPFTRVTDLPSRRSPRTVRTNRLVVPTSRLSTVGSRAFPIAGLQTWNDLPEDVTSAESLTTFRRLLKTHLLRKSFPDYLLVINWLSPVDLAVVPLLRPPNNCSIDLIETMKDIGSWWYPWRHLSQDHWVLTQWSHQLIFIRLLYSRSGVDLIISVMATRQCNDIC